MKKQYAPRKEVCADFIDYIEMFCNCKRIHLWRL